MKANTTKNMLKYYNQRVYEKNIEGYGEKKGARKYNYDQAHKNASSMLHLENKDTLLDVCCGSGTFTVRFGKGCKYICGTDISIEMLKIAKRRAKKHNLKIDFIVADAEHLPFKDKSFDHCVAFQALHHVTKPQNCLLEMERISNKKVLTWEPNKFNPFHIIRRRIRKIKRGSKFNPDLHDLSAKEWRTMFKKSNLKSIRSKTATFIPWDIPNYLFPPFKLMDKIFENTPLLKKLGGNILIAGDSLFEKNTKIPKELLDILVCPICKSDLHKSKDRLVCKKCNKRFPIKEGIPILLPF